MKKKLNSVLLFGVLMTITITSNAQLSMVADLQKTLNTAGSDPSMFIEMKGYLYFAATDPISGTELWRTDGTKAGTVLVKDIRQGIQSSSPSNFYLYKGNLFFQANNGTSGTELWKSDGTEEGTKMVMDIYPYYQSSSPKNFIYFGGLLFFQASDSNGVELWKSDGTDSGTFLVKDIFPDTLKKGVPNSSNPQNFLVVNGILFFQAISKNNGIELWKTDGTKAGTVLIKDINADTLNSDPKEFIDLNSTLYFVATNNSGDELWKSDGTAAGTVMVKDINSTGGSSITFMTKFNNKLYFSADNGSDGAELWTSDGTGTILLKNINTKSGLSSSYPSLFTEFNGKLYFTATNGINGFELWVSDGTSAGTTQLKDIFAGSSGSEPALFTAVGNNLYFVAQNTGLGNELWKTDGTLAGTIMVMDILPNAGSSNPRSLISFNNMLVFNAEEGSYGRELWKSDGTTTVQIKDIYSGTKPSNPSQLVRMKTNIYFAAESTANGKELFKSDGTILGTNLVKDIIGGISSSSPENLININDVLYFSAMDNTNGNELWKSNGTPAGTVMIKNINPDVYASDPHNFCNVNGILYFAADDGVEGIELWRSDGVPNGTGTYMVKNIYSGQGLNGPNSSNPSDLVNVNNTLYFRATDSTNGTELWKSDGSEAGTVLVKDIKLGTSSSVINDLFSYKGMLLFAANDSINGIELWKSEGSESTTMMVTDLFTDTTVKGQPNSSNPQYFCELNGKVYFQASSKTYGTELWQTDGTDTGTKLLKDIMPGSYKGFGYSSTPQYLTKVGNEIFFSASSPANGNELWKTDGTTTGTVLFKNINPGYNSSNPNNLLAAGTNLYFVADDGTHGSELWKAENNQCGKTQMTGEIIPGATGIPPSNLCMLNTVVFFTGTDNDHSTELWKYIPVFTFADTTHLSYSLCNGDSVKFSDKYNYVKIAGDYKDSLKTYKSCDSLVITNIVVNPTYTKTKEYKRCAGDSVKVGNTYIKATGTYNDNPKTYKGCDSILVYNLSFTPKPPTPVITRTGTIKLSSNAPSGNQWYDDNGPISGEKGVDYTTNGKKGKYYVIVTIDSCSSDPSNKMDPLGINEKLVFMNIEIHPNPVSDKLIIEYSGKIINGYFYNINNIQGKALLQGKLTNAKNEIDVSTLNRGIYFVKIILDDQINLIKILKD